MIGLVGGALSVNRAVSELSARIAGTGRSANPAASSLKEMDQWIRFATDCESGEGRTETGVPPKASVAALFWTFFRIGAFTIGGDT